MTIRWVRTLMLVALLPVWIFPPERAVDCRQPPGASFLDLSLRRPLPAQPVSANPSPASLSYTLAIYYVLPADIPYNPALYNRLRDSAEEMRSWYQLASGGLTWEYAYPEVVRVYHGLNERQYYLDNGNWWGSLLTEMGSAGYPVWESGIVTLLWAQGAGWWAGAAWGCESQCGMALLGAELFPEFNNPAWSGGECPDPDGHGVEAWPCTPVGAMAHELGHTVGLIHPLDDPLTAPYAWHSLMQSHWNYPDEAPAEARPWGFLRTERKSLRLSPFMKPDQPLTQPFEALDVAVNLPPGSPPPQASFDLLLQGRTVTLTNTTPAADLTYWTFGDQAASSTFSPAHTYAATGVYTVTLRASSINSTMAVVTQTLNISDEKWYLPLVYR